MSDLIRNNRFVEQFPKTKEAELDKFFDVILDTGNRSVASLSAMANKSRNLLGFAVQHFRAAKQRSFRQWVSQALLKGASKAHRWTKQLLAPSLPDSTVPSRLLPNHYQAEFTPTNLPKDLVDFRRETRAAKWGEQTEGIQQQIHDKMHHLRELATAEPPLTKHSHHNVRNAFRLLMARRGQGLDAIHAKSFSSLPEPAYLEIADLFNQCEHLSAWAMQFLFIRILLILKKDLTDRSIGVSHIVQAAWQETRAPLVSQWRAKYSHIHDSATAGNSAATAAYNSQLRLRLIVPLVGLFFLLALDISVFFMIVYLSLCLSMS